MENDKSILQIVNEVCEAICDDYCKHSDLFKNVHMTDEEFDNYTAEFCDKCPLNRLR